MPDVAAAEPLTHTSTAADSKPAAQLAEWRVGLVGGALKWGRKEMLELIPGAFATEVLALKTSRKKVGVQF